MKKQQSGNCPICGKRFVFCCGVRYDHVTKYSNQWKKMVHYRAEEWCVHVNCFDCGIGFDEYFDHFFYYNQRCKEIKAILKDSPYFVLEPLTLEEGIKK